MSSDYSEKYFSIILLIVLMALSVILLTLKLDPSVQAFKKLFVYFIFPSVETANKVLDYGFVVSGNIYQLINVQQDNTRLQSENERLIRWKSEYNEIFLENQRLRDLLVLKNRQRYDTIGMKVIGRDTSDWFRSCLVNKGYEDGISVDNPVIAVQGNVSGLVGRIVEVAPNTSKVLFLTDSLSTLAVSSRRSGDDGVIQGQGESELLLKYILPKADMRTGDELVTAGSGGIFPAGIPVGTVIEVTPERLGDFRQADVNTAINFSRIKEVMVLKVLGEEAFKSNNTKRGLMGGR